MYNYKTGDIFLTRNHSKIGNKSPGYWNHAAILFRNYVIEAQEDINVVCAVPINVFWRRYPEIRVIRFPKISYSMGVAAVDYVGEKYSRYTFNCTTLINECHTKAAKFDTKWLLPDDISVDQRIIPVYYKYEYSGWKNPEKWYEGIITDQSELI